MVLAASGSLIVLVTGAVASPSRLVAGAQFQLILPLKGTCPPANRLGYACVDRPAIAEWTIGDGGARWDHRSGGQLVWQTKYQWQIPTAVTLSGAAFYFGVEAADTVGGRICPAIIVTPGFTVRGLAGQLDVGVCSEARRPASRTKTVALLPPPNAAPGAIMTLTVRVEDGPIYTYTYRAIGTPKKPKPPPLCRRAKALDESAGGPSAPAQKPGCEYVVKFSFYARDKPETGGRLKREGRTAKGHGTLTGTSLDHLAPVGKKGDNVISFNAPEGGRIGILGRGELRVFGGRVVRQTFGTYIDLFARVEFSTAEEGCVEGADAALILWERRPEVTSPVYRDYVGVVSSCGGFFAEGPTAQQGVGIEITTR